jgi:ABC-type lipoprotein release transport system permease subunit
MGAVLLGRAISAALFGIAPVDPTVLGGASLLLLTTAFAATWFPAHRASRLDPASTLRAD